MALWFVSIATKYSSTSATRAKALSRLGSFRSVTTSILQRSCRSAMNSKLSSSRRKTKKAGCSSPRSVLSTSVPGAQSKRSKNATAWSPDRSSKLSRVASSSISASVASCQHRWWSSVGSAICSRTSAVRSKPRSSSWTRTATTLCFHVGPTWKRRRRNSAKTSWPTSPLARFAAVLFPRSSTSAPSSISAVWTDSSTFPSCPGSTSITPVPLSLLATKSPFRCSKSTSTGSASASRSRPLSRIRGRNSLPATGLASWSTAVSPSWCRSVRSFRSATASRVLSTSPRCRLTTSIYPSRSSPLAKSSGSRSSISTCSVVGSACRSS
ncbi:UNVERIFIED_CONTAM: hypothetical protein GTU68_014981, partial [Idotea baltica]|nr:hypothetical protein [Idotea baltica]